MISHHGTQWNFDDLEILPRCLQQPSPAGLDGGTHRRIRRAGRPARLEGVRRISVGQGGRRGVRRLPSRRRGGRTPSWPRPDRRAPHDHVRRRAVGATRGGESGQACPARRVDRQRRPTSAVGGAARSTRRIDRHAQRRGVRQRHPATGCRAADRAMPDHRRRTPAGGVQRARLPTARGEPRVVQLRKSLRCCARRASA